MEYDHLQADKSASKEGEDVLHENDWMTITMDEEGNLSAGRDVLLVENEKEREKEKEGERERERESESEKKRRTLTIYPRGGITLVLPDTPMTQSILNDLIESERMYRAAKIADKKRKYEEKMERMMKKMEHKRAKKKMKKDREDKKEKKEKKEKKKKEKKHKKR